MWYLYQDPVGKKVFSSSTGPIRGGENPPSNSSDGDGNTKEKAALLERQVQELELEIQKCHIE